MPAQTLGPLVRHRIRNFGRDERDRRMAFVKQMLNGFPCAVYVIRAYTVCLDFLQEPVDQNEGETVQRASESNRCRSRFQPEK